MGDGHGKGGFPLLMVTVLVSVVGSAAFWISLESGREEGRHRAEREAVEAILSPLFAELQRAAKAEPDEILATSFGSAGGDSGREWTCVLNTRKRGKVLNATIRLALEGRLRKRSTGIRVETEGLALDGLFVRRLSEELALKGLRIASSTP